MKPFPKSEERKAAIQQRYGRNLDIASRMFTGWMDNPPDPGLARSNLPREVKILASLLNTQICRQFRSAVELCAIGEAYNASIVGRSIFETVLAVQFILAPEFHITVEQQRGKGPERQPLPGKWIAKVPTNRSSDSALPRELRGLIFGTHNFFQAAEISETFAAYHVEDGGGELEPAPELSLIDTAKADVGPEWAYILTHHPNTYSGLNIRSLAEAAGDDFVFLYKRVYKNLSRMVHGVDAFSHAAQDAATGDYQQTWFSGDDDVFIALYCVSAMFRFHMQLMHAYVDLDAASKALVEAFGQEILASADEQARL